MGLLAALAVPAPVLADGLIRFSGRIVEAPCVASISAANEVMLSNCPMAAAGSTLEISSLSGQGPARLVDPASGAGAGEVPVAAETIVDNKRNFSSRYHIEPAAQAAGGTYMLRIDYL
ncbi:hypothetical protein [Novilysobacter spongiicola]|uniref:hypothetical protein n=1 Tax=Novilysobacter spongiicola TaxID=435289 RepID=UPI000998F455|nr:hypothetical protein [Lysobacter spongiicola]